MDMKLGAIMAIGTIAGVEAGAQVIQALKQKADLDLVVASGFIFVLVAISVFMGWESIGTMRSRKEADTDAETDVSSFGNLAKRVHGFRLRPMISLPDSGIEHISLWAILAVAFVGGVFSGFLGGGAGYIRMPSMVFLLGVPTHIAVGTDLFEIMISASYGTLTHAFKGNVDILVALVMNMGAAFGAQIGANLTEHFQGRWIRLAFTPLPIIGAGLVVYALASGHHFG